jgi:cytoskeletal protein RodZ
VSRPRRPVGRYVAVLCVVLLGAILAFAFGETIQRMFTQNQEPVKHATVAKKPGHKKSTATGSGRRRRSRRSERAVSATTGRSSAGDAVVKSGEPSDSAQKPTEPATDESGSDTAPAPSDPEPSGAEEKKPEGDTSGA